MNVQTAGNGKKDSTQQTYQSLLSDHTTKANSLSLDLNWLSLLRILLFIGSIFFAYKALVTGFFYFTISAIVLFVIFLIILRWYDKLQMKVSFYKALTKINGNEINFLEGKPSAYAGGKEYTDPHHPYSYDLDIFGEGGLFPYLNRTGTSFGQQALADSLLHPDKKAIQQRQEAIAELTGKLEFRQQVQAYGMIQETKDRELSQLKAWIASTSVFSNKNLYYGLLIFPLATLSCLTWYFISEKDSVLNLFYGLFVLNLVVAFSFTRKISSYLSVSTSVTKVLEQFSWQLSLIESHSFQSGLLKEMQQKLKGGNISASRSIAKLASLFNSLETIINLVVSILLNGLFLFHIHVLFRLEKWKQQNGKEIMNWLQLLGEIEALNSFANLSYNNPSFCQPALKDTEALHAIDMGHPLIRAEKRITNSISFNEHPFVILTGSNMSGKSTFLRTLGINLVLARAGSVVCAKQFELYPYHVHVSMRISDSLQDSESFFYAELKKLQQIIHELEAGKKTFVILDEILRGTNSNDKHNGTVGLIRKLTAAHACGIIATHDLTVSKLATEYPDHISNQCFESKIINDELLFDYKLGDGVCTTLSASFLMKKMGVI
ncbi:MAG: DNA mismatch repair protein MutS [Chitinophagaceae bacterium]